MVCGSVEIYLHALVASRVDANCVQLLAFANLCAGKDININRRLGGTQNCYGHFRDKMQGHFLPLLRM